jgi:hypothetical protein
LVAGAKHGGTLTISATLAVAPAHGRYVTVTLQSPITLGASIFRNVSWFS